MPQNIDFKTSYTELYQEIKIIPSTINDDRTLENVKSTLRKIHAFTTAAFDKYPVISEIEQNQLKNYLSILKAHSKIYKKILRDFIFEKGISV